MEASNDGFMNREAILQRVNGYDNSKEVFMMHLLFEEPCSMPDVQYHFTDMEPSWVVNHAYNMLSYIYRYGNPIEGNDPIDGVANGKVTREVTWRCQYENSIMQPARPLIDIYMNEYAAGIRHD